jgi:hypothetical protein
VVTRSWASPVASSGNCLNWVTISISSVLPFSPELASEWRPSTNGLPHGALCIPTGLVLSEVAGVLLEVDGGE